jgi:hypothetical protein
MHVWGWVQGQPVWCDRPVCDAGGCWQLLMMMCAA